MTVLRRKYIVKGLIIGSSACLPLQLSAQPTRGISIAKAAIVGALDQAAGIDGRFGPLFIDASSFSRILKIATGEDIDIQEVARAAGGRAVTAPSEKLVCNASALRVCRIAEDGLLVLIDSLSLSPTGGDALVQYQFNIRRGLNRDIPQIAFVQVHLVLQRDGDSWRVTRREISKRS